MWLSRLFGCLATVANYRVSQGAVGKGPRYAVYDVEYQLASGEGIRYGLNTLTAERT